MKLGVDVSTYFEVLSCGGKFMKDGEEVDPLAEFRKNGVTGSRIRVWVDPYDEEGNPYLGGTCDEANFFRLAELMISYGCDIMLDFHYSDFWADPSKQLIPKAWKGKSTKELGEAVYSYTCDFLKKCSDKGIKLPYIQIGNEITNGMLWPDGHLTDNPDGTRGNYKNLCYFLTCASRACRELSPESKIIVHLERSHLMEMHKEYFDNLRFYGVDYDVIGLSYYPYWHGTLAMFEDSVKMLQSRYGKEVMLVETGYGFTMAPFLEEGVGQDDALVIGEKFLSGIQWEIPYDLTPDGQDKFVKHILSLSEKLGITGVYYWEPCWVPGNNICWASRAGEKYTGETDKNTVNEWANQCLFDYQGNMLPAFNSFKK
ncbi:MAG: arabinogalactan endo-1,4-beta-galactosidase [Clostridia bacterium]|nr:arabinogalactan endo-1,4-beta-galactosidase [Clostridia bacterium]